MRNDSASVFLLAIRKINKFIKPLIEQRITTVIAAARSYPVTGTIRRGRKSVETFSREVELFGRNKLDPGISMYLCVSMSTSARAKLFRHGGSQAARLPREFRLPGTEAAVSRTPTGGVLLEPIDADFEFRRKKFFALAGSCPDLPDVPPHSAPDIARDE